MSMISIVGQEYAKARLGKLFFSEPGHAYIFLGPDGIGKRTLAREAAKGLLCSRPDENGACDTCGCCHYFDGGTHPDFRELAVSGGESLIKVESVRSQICGDVNVFPQIANRKVYLIDGDGLNEQGQNALLKTLEEPPPNVVFFITGTDISRFLSTVISRAEIISLRPNTESELTSLLQKLVGLSPEESLPFVRFSEGIPGRAVSLSSSTWFAELRGEAADVFFSLSGSSVTCRLTTVYSFFEENRDHISDILTVWQMILRDLAVLSCGQEESRLMNADFLQKMTDFLRRRNWTSEWIDSANRVLSQTFSELRANCSFESAVCGMLLSLP